MRKSKQGLRFVSMHEGQVTKVLALVAQGIVDVIPDALFAIKTVSWLRQPMMLLMRMVKAQCSTLQTATSNPLGDFVKALKMYKDPELEK